MEAPPLPEPLYRLPLPQAAQWQNAINCAEREPFKPVQLEAQTVLAVHDAVERAVKAERERCIAACEAQYEPHNDSYHDMAVQQCVNAIRAHRD